jgi:hypothetical protein
MHLTHAILASLSLFLLSACSSLPLQKDASDIKASILQITPLGISKSEANNLIIKEIHPKRIRFYDSRIGAAIAEINRFPLPFLYVTWTQIDAQWYFDTGERLIDVQVTKSPHGM